MRNALNGPSRDSRFAQRGVVLVIALILLVAVSLIGALAMRGAISGEQVNKSLRSSTMAQQAAETALRYCEDRLINHAGAGVTVVAFLDKGADQELWKSRASWKGGTGKATTVPAELVNSASDGARALAVANLPKCMIEELRLPAVSGGPTQTYRVTAVGYSADYAEDAQGRPQAGGEAWVQSVVRM